LIPPEVKTDIEKKLSAEIIDTSPLSGGCIHNALKIQTSEANYFLKWNNTAAFENFSAEAKNLQILNNSNTIRVPRFFFIEKIADYSYILLEFIEPAGRKTNFWEDFGQALAQLHRNSNDQFGLEFDNFIGSLPQSNKFHRNWTDFFIQERLEKQLRLAEKQKLAGPEIFKKFATLYKKLDFIFPPENPALIHGDLWLGNYITGPGGLAVIFDPAVYYGHREIELSFTNLFGSFDQRFYDAYREIYPVEPGFSERADVYNLYPLLVHLNLFGSSYLGQIKVILARF
jgi:protein-ribulosamine 3-kinase